MMDPARMQEFENDLNSNSNSENQLLIDTQYLITKLSIISENIQKLRLSLE